MTNLKEKDLISLKDASKASGYSADYIGQLIREGKIPGKQVYTNISWMTTAEAVIAYKNNKNKTTSFSDKLITTKRRLEMELSIIRLIFQNFKSALPLMIILFIIFGTLVYSIFYFTYNADNSNTLRNNQNQEEIISF